MSILDKFLGESIDRVALTGFLMSISDAAKHFLIEKGTNLRYGARPLRRAVREYLEFPLANMIAERPPNDRNQAVYVDAGYGGLRFQFEKLSHVVAVG
jgi:ATP-dependent Clp protease ATP-binding subunit ClpA